MSRSSLSRQVIRVPSWDRTSEVDTRGPLIDDEQCDIVLAQFAGDRAEGRLRGQVRVEELVRFFDSDDQRGRLFAFVTHGIFGQFRRYWSWICRVRIFATSMYCSGLR